MFDCSTDVVEWRKSSRSEDSVAVNCVEIGTTLQASAILLRDSKHPDGPVLHLGRAAWSGVLADQKR